MPTHYEVLGVRPSLSAAEIRKAYLGLAREYHPDNFAESGLPRSEAEARMQAINAAWAVVGDEDRRKKYDKDLRKRGVLIDEPAPVEEVSDEPKRVYRRPPPPKPSKLGLLPAATLVLAIGALVLGLVQSSTPFLIAAVGLSVLAAILFFGMPRLLAARKPNEPS